MHHNRHYDGGGKGVGGFILGVLAALGVSYLIKKKMSHSSKMKVKGWMWRMKGEIMDRFENLKDKSSEAYDEIVDEVAEKFEDLKNIDREDVERFAERLKRKWRWLNRE